MKKVTYLFGMLAALLTLSSCNEGTDFDVDYTPIAPIGGQYDIIIYEGEDASKSDAEFWASVDVNDNSKVEQLCSYGEVYAYLSNTTDYDSDKAWLRIGGLSANKSFNINAKLSINMGDYTFTGVNVDNFAGNSAKSIGTVNVSGFCKHNGIKTEGSGTTTDYIEFIYSRSDYPGMHYKAVGFKYTGWPEDEE